MIFDLYDRPKDFLRLAESCTEFAIALVAHSMRSPVPSREAT